MKKPLSERKIPTLFGIFAILIGIFLTSYVSGNINIFQGHASSSEDPKEIRISNISDSSFTVSYHTDSQIIGSLLYGDTTPNTSVFDDRDQRGSLTNRLSHYITVKNLLPSTTYAFDIISGQTTYTSGSIPFKVTTAPTISFPASGSAVTGSILLPSGEAPKEGIVYIQSDTTQTFSTLTDSTGFYSMNLKTLRTKDLLTPAKLEDTSLTLFANGDSLSSQANISSEHTQVPPITLSNNYDFTVNQIPLSVTPVFVGFPTLPATTSATTNLQIINQTSIQNLTDQQPLFRGTAPPRVAISLVFAPNNEVQNQVLSDINVGWPYGPSIPIPPGAHTILITAKNQNSISQTVSQAFVVLASGTQVEVPATPSATLVPPTPTPTTAPTATPIPLLTQPPISGDSKAVKGGIVALITTIAGVLILLVSRGTMSL